MTLIDLAIRQALRSTCRFRVGAVLACGKRVLAGSPNLRRNHPMIDFRHATFHAEAAALRRTRSAAGSVIYIARIDRTGEPQLARPCPECQLILSAAGISRAYYTTSTGIAGMAIPAGNHPRRPRMDLPFRARPEMN